jgi:septum formation protein
MKLVLASSSPDRKKLFDFASIPIEVISSNFDEDKILETDPYKLVQRLALEKAKVVCNVWKQKRQAKEGPAVIIGADTTVVFQNKSIGKAASKEEAFQILSGFRGKTHEIITGVAVLSSQTNLQEVFLDSSTVHFQDLSDDELWDYINVTDEYRGRAGAYSLFERASLFVDNMTGSPTNIIGLPLPKLRLILKKFGINLLHPK